MSGPVFRRRGGGQTFHVFRTSKEEFSVCGLLTRGDAERPVPATLGGPGAPVCSPCNRVLPAFVEAGERRERQADVAVARRLLGVGWEALP